MIIYNCASVALSVTVLDTFQVKMSLVEELLQKLKCTPKNWYFYIFIVFLSIWMYKFGRGGYEVSERDS